MLWSAIALLVPAALLASLPFARPAAGPAPGPLRWPLVAFVALVLVFYVDQVLFNVYVARVHHGSVAFLDPYLPSSFLHLALDHGPVVFLAQHLPDARLLAPTSLRVAALLELPFALASYLAIAALFDRGLAVQLARGPLGPLTALVWTAVLCAIELLLHNPWTTQDLVLRGVSALVCSLGLRALGRGDAGPEAPSAPRLLLFLLGAPPLIGLVLATNAIALLYNLGWLRPLGPLIALCALWLVPVLALRDRPAAPSPSVWVAALFAIGRRFVLLFAAPSLAIRYAASHPTGRLPAALSGLAIVAIAFMGGLRDAPHPRRRLVPPAMGGLAGALLALLTLGLPPLRPLLRQPDLAIGLGGGLSLLGFVGGGLLVEALHGNNGDSYPHGVQRGDGVPPARP